MVEELVFNVGRKLKKLREELGLSLRQLGEKAGVAPSTIQKVENNQISPTLGTILKITQAVGKDIQFFLDGTRAGVSFSPRRGRRRLEPGNLKLGVEFLSDGLSDQRFSALLLIVPPGGKRGAHLLHQGEELQYCLSGTIEFTIHGKKYLLRPGDTIHFKADLKHSWANAGNEEARLLMVCSPPLLVGRTPSPG